MPDLDSAEAVTKFLRSKTELLPDILELAGSVVSGAVPAYLPGANTFVLDLLVDRFNENGNGQFKEWIYSPQAWQLFSSTYLLFSDRSRASRLLRRLHLIDVTCTVFSKNRDPLCWESIFVFFGTTQNASIINIDHALATNLLGAFCNSLSHVDTDPSSVLRWTVAIILLYRIPLYNNSATKKSYTRFAHECAPKILFHISNNSDEASNLLRDLLISEMYGPEALTQLKQAIQYYIDKCDLPPAHIATLFRIMIEQMAASHISECEEVFRSIVHAPQYTLLAEELLLILTSTNKTLSYAFLSQVYAEILEKPMNWTLINHLVLLDAELGMKNALDLFHRLISAPIDETQKLALVMDILTAFRRGRELHTFIFSVWIPVIPELPLFSNAEFILSVSAATHDLSAMQIGQFLHELCSQLPHKSAIPPIVAILRGLISSPPPKTDAAKKAILPFLAAFMDSNDDLWEVRYCILCLYGDSSSFGELAFSAPSKYSFYTFFRLAELANDDAKVSQYYPQFVTFLQQNPSLVIPAIRRWGVYLNRFFELKMMIELIAIMFETSEISQIVQFLIESGDVIYEQPNLVHALVQYIASKIESESSLTQILALVPVQCIDKYHKTFFLDRLLSIAIQESSNTESALQSMNHILVFAPFKSKLETDLECLKSLLIPGVMAKSRSEIVCQVWKNHMSQYGVESSKRFVDASLKSCLKLLGTCSSPENLARNLPMLLIILANSNEEVNDSLQQLSKKLKSVLLHCLDGFKITEESHAMAASLIEAMSLVIDENDNDHDMKARLEATMIKLDHNIDRTSGSSAIRTALFKLIVKVTEVKLADAKYVSALFLTLESQSGLQLLSHMEQYVSRLPSETHSKLYAYILALADMIDAEYITAYTHLLMVLLRSLRKGSDSQPLKLFNWSLSVVLGKMKEFTVSVLGEVLEAIKSSLCDQMWLFDQHAIESTLVVVNQAASIISVLTDHCEAVFICATQVVAHVLLFHRYKLSLRHHLVLSSHTSLLQALCVRDLSLLSKSVDAAEAYSRLLGNLCEPSNTNDHRTNGLNTVAATIKRSLRKFLPVLLTNYVYLSLKFNFAGSIVESLTTGMFKVFDVLSQLELQLVSASLDVPGKTYFKTLYNDYKEHGKWHDT